MTSASPRARSAPVSSPSRTTLPPSLFIQRVEGLFPEVRTAPVLLSGLAQRGAVAVKLAVSQIHEGDTKKGTSQFDRTLKLRFRALLTGDGAEGWNWAEPELRLW